MLKKFLALFQPPNTYRNIAIGLGIGGLGVILASLLAYAIRFWAMPVGESEDWGTFGDFVGGFAGTFLGLLTLAAIAITLHLQANELEDTRSALQRQAFESMFVQMLGFFDKTVESLLEKKTSAQQTTYKRAKEHIRTCLTENAGNPQYGLADAYRDMYHDKQGELGPYFRAFYHVINFVDTAKLKLSDDERANLCKHRAVPTRARRSNSDADECGISR